MRPSIQHYPDAAIQLYNLDRDIGEKTNVDSQPPEIMEQLQEIFRESAMKQNFSNLKVYS